ncbi:MAG: CDP-alcohol phosphatidyltransferase family protein [Pseudomonadota bacterium]|nr:CDP-alcohol phosphatidyltransferase family protein [Pseudomonadota bacterium]
MSLNIPNVISFGRLLCVPIAVWLILNQHYLSAFWVLVFACISDAADGFIATRFKLKTDLGGLLDPIADKTLLVSVFITMGYSELIANWLVILVVFRDGLILCGAFLYNLQYGRLIVQPLFVSKFNTALQFILVALILEELAYGFFSQDVITILTYLVGFTTIISGSAYVIKWGRAVFVLEQDK